MILVDVYVVATENHYDFLLDENVPVVQIMTEISDMISKKVMGKYKAKPEEFLLCSMDTKKILNPALSLHMNKIQDGSKLLFV